MQNDIREPGIIQNPTPPSPLLQMSSESHHFNDSYNSRPNQFQPTPFTQTTMSPFTSNGYVTHDAIIAKVKFWFLLEMMRMKINLLISIMILNI